LVHHAVEPGNLWITFDGEKVSLLDAGSTTAAPEYAAPELTSDPSKVDIRADIYSLGCTLFQLLTGQLPTHGKTPPNPRQLKPDLPAPLAVIVQKMLAQRPNERYKTPAAVVLALASFRQPHAPRVSLAPFHPDPSARRRL
jgi:serine/threonine protein kinase